MSKATFDKWSKGVAAQQPSPSPAEVEQEHVYLSFILFHLLSYSLSLSLTGVCVHMLLEYLCDFYKKKLQKNRMRNCRTTLFTSCGN